MQHLMVTEAFTGTPDQGRFATPPYRFTQGLCLTVAASVPFQGGRRGKVIVYSFGHRAPEQSDCAALFHFSGVT